MLYFAWVIPYAVFAVVVAVAFVRFLGHLPSRTRLGFLVSGGLYVSGALGLELLEMAGVVLLLSTLLTYLHTHWPTWQVRLRL